MHPRDTHETTPFIELRGPSGRLYGRLDPVRMVLEVKRKGELPEEIDLRAYFVEREVNDEQTDMGARIRD